MWYWYQKLVWKNKRFIVWFCTRQCFYWLIFLIFLFYIILKCFFAVHKWNRSLVHLKVLLKILTISWQKCRSCKYIVLVNASRWTFENKEKDKEIKMIFKFLLIYLLKAILDWENAGFFLIVVSLKLLNLEKRQYLLPYWSSKGFCRVRIGHNSIFA